ncbi:MAG: ABC transporter permease [Oscillospiraceae bacterium]
MLKYCLKKAGQVAIVMLLISFFSFAIIDLAPGDISSMYITEDMTEEEKAIVIEKLGLDKSMPEQYLAWLGEALKGNFGVSLSYKTPVMPMLTKRLPSTILLMGTSLAVSLALSIPLGLIAGYKKNTWIDNAISGFAYFGMSIPSFYFGMLMIILFTATLHLLPSSGMHSVGVNTPIDTLKHMIMPVMTMALSSMASKVRYVRANTIGQLSEEYVLAAKAKGTSPVKILFKHVLKNTLLPIITIVGMNMASLVCGSFIIESVFGWPGIGSFAMEAIGKRDYTIIMAYIMLSGFILVMGNFVADILYSFADPRIKRGIDVANGK